jgi:hypothetical protein
MPKRNAQPTITPEILDEHPMRLTRLAQTPVIKGTYTIEQLRDTFGVEGDENAVLKALATKGHAFFKQGDEYTSFDPQLGDLDLPLDADVNPTTVKVTSFADADAAKEALFPSQAGTPIAPADDVENELEAVGYWDDANTETQQGEPIVAEADLEEAAQEYDTPIAPGDEEDGEDGDADDLNF